MVNEVRSAGTFTINGSAVVIHQSCPMAADTPFTFDGDGIVTTLYSMPINGKVIAYTFTKQ
jgi:hypothetical protein